MFSKQIFYCRICGTKLFVSVNASYQGFCGKDCCNEYHWRETLSILGKEYYPKPESKEDK